MTNGDQGQPRPDPKVAPETLDLRARPQPVTRINRKVVIAAAAVLLCVFFRLLLKPAPKETKTTDVRVDPVPKPAPIETDGGLAALSALRAADRALALAGGDTDLIGSTLDGPARLVWRRDRRDDG